MQLANYAIRQTAGRRYPTEPDPLRRDFRRDIGRVLYSKAFRRLAFKTQVFSPEGGGNYRNRLTHTLECAQIARVVAEHLKVNTELAEVIALAHDLGHPPFGHQGEYVLDKLMKKHGGFDHNLQNLRIVTLLEVKSNEYPGLNLTYETLMGIAKGSAAKEFYKVLFDPTPEQSIVSVEARIADIADDLAYTAHDFDDYAQYHNLSVHELQELDLALVQRCLPKEVSDPHIAISICVRNLVSTLVTDMIVASIAAIESLGGDDAPREAVEPSIGLSESLKTDFDELSAFLNKKMYRDANVKADTLKGADTLEKIFLAEKDLRQLDPQDTSSHQRLCDEISCMSDREALNRFIELEAT